ncbi:TPA: AAA family ATPase [Raoultella planticola]|uniref:AAA family ATPase n=1 Tax=Raoultella planticola TaxID=575 RepID=UPI00062BBCB2|nr:AAA family ATPase [Raoultella planticola]
MVNLPILKSLKINNYKLYPGNKNDNSLFIDFEPQGLTVILGANGLGKSTLINLILRMLTGPSDISKIDSIDELGNLNTTAVDRNDLKYFFSERVSDKAENATATLQLKLGEITLTIERKLSDLTLIDLKTGATTLPLPENRKKKENIYKEQICDFAKVASFGDWLLILHYIMFYQENRRALVWDTSAQREILRILLLKKEQSQKWRELSRHVLKLDSDYRNYRNSVTKEIKSFEKTLISITDKEGTSAKIAAERKIRESKIKELDRINDHIQKISLKRNTLRVELLTINNNIDTKEKISQKNKIELLSKLLPTSDDTARYISSVLFSEINVSDTKNQQQNVINAIGTFLEREFLNKSSIQEDIIDIDHYDIQQSIPELKKEKEKLISEINLLTESYSSLEKKSNILLDEINDLNIKILPLETELAKDEKPITKLQLQLDALISLKKDKETKLKEAHTEFTNFLNEVESEFFDRADEIQEEFNKIVQGFLIEDCEVTWAKTDWKLGQEERPIKFPAFLFKMSSNGNSGVTIRTNPSQVSESQREFIDLAFRISLIKVVTYNSSGSIVMDAPESSLDAVFVDRAAHVFNEFSSQGNNKLILASNLIDGLLLPMLLAQLMRDNKMETGLVNLFDKGVPSRAVYKFKEDYNRYLKQVIDKAKELADND